MSIIVEIEWSGQLGKVAPQVLGGLRDFSSGVLQLSDGSDFFFEKWISLECETGGQGL